MINKLIQTLFLGIIFLGCANQLPPGGGPIDKDPPFVIKTFPESGTLYYNLNYVEFEFNEYINKRTVSNSIFISPYFEENFEIKWSGKKLKIIFPEKLKENKTYVISLGTDITDLRGNKLNESINLKFSTGDKIDDGIISGKLFDPKPDGVMIYFYLIDFAGQQIRYDSIRPDFITQTSKDGSFSLAGLPEGIFRIIAVRDALKNFSFDTNEDEIGLPSTDYYLSDTNKVINNVYFELMKIDTVKPRVNSVKVLDRNHIKINLDESIDSGSFDLNKIVLRDSLNSAYKLYGFYGESNFSIVFVSETLEPDKRYYLELDGLKDLAGNQIEKTLLDFYVENLPDTSHLELLKIECNYSSNVMEFFEPVCKIYFSDIVSYLNFVSSISVTDTFGNNRSFRLERTDSSNFILKFDDLKQKEKLILKINLGRLTDFSEKKLDTIITKMLETNSESEYGSISGSIKLNRNNYKICVNARNVEKPKSYFTSIDENKYSFKNVIPGKYLVKVFLPDSSNSNEMKLYSKPFYYYPDTIKVKSRWPTTDVNFDANELFR